MYFRLLILSLFFLVSCMPEAQVGKSNISNSNNPTGSTNGGTTPPGANRPVLWNYLGQDTTTITVSSQNLQTSYIGGTQVETYLSVPANYGGTDYCAIIRFSVAGEIKELRTRTVPFQYMDFSLQRFVKMFRVDFNDVTSSVSACGTGLETKVQSPTTLQYITEPPSTPPAISFNSPSALVDGYNGVIHSSSVGVYQKKAGVLYKVPDAQLKTQALLLQIDPNGNPGGGVGTCSNTGCQANNYDCCLDNQCVINGAPRPGMIGTPLYQIAEAQRLTNPQIYLVYPQVYYVCGTSNSGGSSGGSTTGGTNNGGSTGGSTPNELTRSQKDYYCIENIKGQSTVVPYHLEIEAKTFSPATTPAICLTGTSPTEKADPDHFFNVFKRLYQQCGCAATSLSEMINTCPNYEYKVKTWESVGGEQRPTSFECSVVELPEPPANERTVQVNSRSAPHRFFPVGSTSVQEGTPFSYDDPNDLMTPIQEPLSMNAILGQISLGLSQAQPAKTLDVELDRVYFLTTNRGTYSPCPTCSKDSWLDTFSAFPTTTYGTGLQSVGFTTKRDQAGSNDTFGNYEDTIFGRACWVPPTMLPYSQTLTTSRIDRLKAQSALFANGYQRDWFGFNKGSLIGSFDGVTWFAIGQGRIIRSTSTKLFLAINAPFADLADPTIHEVFVQNFNGITQATTVDYDPQFHQDHSLQNAAGTCQKHHMCETDKDCITGLGWEYACADVRDLKTHLPGFDTNANESGSGTLPSGPLTLDQILHQKQLPSSTAKRCVYRGAGAICATTNLADANKKKLLTCAPNFFCAGFNSPYHNTKIARFAGNLADTPIYNSSLFGKSARILGRPLNYIGNESLSSVESTIRQNIVAIDPSILTSATGLCQPGKALPNSAPSLYLNPFEQHKLADSFNGTRRADSINQIASCNASFLNPNRHVSCPVLNATGNYAMFDSPTLPADYAKMATTQNSCGLESLAASGANPFASIEALTSTTSSIQTRSLIQNACLRRAGSVCHTDLDCSPNSLHANVTNDSYPEAFGNEAELNYYKEYLVCGQKDPEPSIYDELGVKNYKMTKNVCCREVGQKLTTYTANVPNKINVVSASDYDPVTAGLKMSLVPGVSPKDVKRYSRLAIAFSTITLSAAQERNPVTPSKLIGSSVNTIDQWRTLAEVNSKTCCGGGWVREFSDGTNDWTKRNRVYLDVTNFRCINSRTPLLTSPKDLASKYGGSVYNVESLVAQDHEEYCKSTLASGAGCAYFPIVNELKDFLPSVNSPYTTTTVRTIAPVFSGANADFYFIPLSADNNSAVYADFTASPSTPRKNISIRIPSYISMSDFDLAIPAIFPVYSDGTTGAACSYNSSLSFTDHTAPPSGLSASCQYNFIPNGRVLRVGFNPVIFANKKVGIQFTVNTAPAGFTRKAPGSSAYYLKRLGRLELSGIPQITFEELYCSDNSERLVPGIFKPAIKTSTDFQSNTVSFENTYTDGNGALKTKRFTNMHALENAPVFSDHKFKCCSPLGMKVGSASVCCSGFGKDSPGTSEKTCALPPGTNLMVYFNKFVSNEGRSLVAGDGKLTDLDFEAQTGEPKLDTAIITKIRSLGTTHCGNGKVRQGGAFGEYPVIPNATSGDKLYNIVDSPFDSSQLSNAGTTVSTGYLPFHKGFKWNHHLYCDD